MSNRRDAKQLAEQFEKDALRYTKRADVLLVKARHCRESAQVIYKDLDTRQEVANAQ